MAGKDVPVSPLAPARFPDMPPIAGVTYMQTLEVFLQSLQEQADNFSVAV